MNKALVIAILVAGYFLSSYISDLNQRDAAKEEELRKADKLQLTTLIYIGLRNQDKASVYYSASVYCHTLMSHGKYYSCRDDLDELMLPPVRQMPVTRENQPVN